MRKIKFRALAENGWVYGVPLFNEENKQIAYILQNSGEYIVRAETVGQFTGLLDCKGKEIYEGDILRYTRKNWKCYGHPEDGKNLIEKIEVSWNDDRHCFWADHYSQNREGIRGYNYCSGYLSFSDDRAKKVFIEVIGNIYENPELKEGKTNQEAQTKEKET